MFERANRREVRNADGDALLEAQYGVENASARLIHHHELRERARSVLPEEHAITDLTS